MTFLVAHLFLIFSPLIFGLSIVSKTDFKDAASTADSEPSGSENKAADFLVFETKNRTKAHTRQYIPIVLKRSDRRIEARIPIIISKDKSTVTERTVPVIRGAAVAMRADQRELASENIEGLQPPAKSATDRWFSNLESNSDGNNYYPNVNGPYTSTPRPVYGVPNQNPGQPNWNNCPSWGSQNGGNGGNHYPPNNYGNNYYPNQGNYPPQQGYPNYPSNQYPMNNYPSHQYPPSNQGWGNSPTPSWQNSNWGSQPQSWNSKQSGRWIPCGPVDLNGSGNQARPSSGCSQTSRTSHPVRFEPPPSLASKIDDKTQFNQIPDDVEEITP